MRKLKLQMQMTIDGFVAGPDGQLDWMTWKWDEKLSAFVNQLTDASDTILLGRKMAPGFITLTHPQPQGFLAVPPTGKGPGVLVLHAWWGLATR